MSPIFSATTLSAFDTDMWNSWFFIDQDSKSQYDWKIKIPLISSLDTRELVKYLVNKEGEVVDYYYSITKPNSSKVKKAIDKLL